MGKGIFATWVASIDRPFNPFSAMTVLQRYSFCRHIITVVKRAETMNSLHPLAIRAFPI